MRKFSLYFLFMALFAVLSCSNSKEQTKEAVAVQSSPAGVVYGWSNPPLGTTECVKVIMSNKYFPKLLFLNDSSFIKEVPASCGDIGACTRYYFGEYSVNEEGLLLHFRPKMLVYHFQSQNLLAPYSELESSDLVKERLVKRNCKGMLFFEECNTQGSLMTPKADTLANTLHYLEDLNILDKLYAL